MTKHAVPTVLFPWHHETHAQKILRVRRSETGAAHRHGPNPFMLPPETLIKRLGAQTRLGNWEVLYRDVERLMDTAPSWPIGRDAFPCFTLRFGEGKEGAALTITRHMEAMVRVHTGVPSYRLRRPVPITLLPDSQHTPAIEWCIVNLSRDHDPSQGELPLAEQGLVMAWLYPERVWAIDHRDRKAWSCTGFRATDPREPDKVPKDVMSIDHFNPETKHAKTCICFDSAVVNGPGRVRPGYVPHISA